jgi:hypothetical protein
MARERRRALEWSRLLPSRFPLRSASLGLRYATPAQDGVPWGSGGSVNENGDESGLRVGFSLNRPPFSSPLSSAEMERKTGENG